MEIMNMVLILICIISGVTITVNLLSQMIEASRGTLPRIETFMGVVFILALIPFIGWWSILIAIILTSLVLVVGSIYAKNRDFNTN